MSMAMAIGAIYCGELQRQTERRIREELEAESMRKMAEKAFPETQVLRSYAESIGMKDGDLVTMDDCPDIFRVTLVDTI